MKTQYGYSKTAVEYSCSLYDVLGRISLYSDMIVLAWMDRRQILLIMNDFLQNELNKWIIISFWLISQIELRIKK